MLYMRIDMNNMLLCAKTFTSSLKLHIGAKIDFLVGVFLNNVIVSVDSWEQLKKAGSACEHGFVFCDGQLCHTCSGNEVSLVIPEDAGLQTNLLR